MALRSRGKGVFMESCSWNGWVTVHGFYVFMDGGGVAYSIVLDRIVLYCIVLYYTSGTNGGLISNLGRLPAILNYRETPFEEEEEEEKEWNGKKE